MKLKKWTDQDITLIKKIVKFDDQNFVSNVQELSELLGVTRSSIYQKIYRLRKTGELPDIYYDDPIYPVRAAYTDRDDHFIINAYKSGAYIKDIAEALGRSEKSVWGRIQKLRNNLTSEYRVKRWSDEECELLVACSKFDQYGYLANVNELMRVTGRSRQAIFKKIELFRKAGKIKTLPDRTHTNEGSKAVFDYYYQIQFCSKQKPTPVPASVSK